MTKYKEKYERRRQLAAIVAMKRCGYLPRPGARAHSMEKTTNKEVG